MSPDEIRTRRLAYPLSVAELAGMLGVARETVHRWEAGRGRIPAAQIRALEAAFGLRAPPSGTWPCLAGPDPCRCRCHAIAAGRRPGDRGPMNGPLKASWRAEETAYLRRAAARGDLPDEIAAHLTTTYGRKRSRRAVVHKVADLGLSWRGGWYSEAEAARMLGVAYGRVKRWRLAGALPAGRHTGRATGVDSRWWRISVDSLEAFVRLHAGIDLDPAGIRDTALRARAEVAAAVNRRRAG